MSTSRWRSLVNSSINLLCLSYFVLLAQTAALAQIEVEDAELREDDVLVESDLFGFRVLSSHFLFVDTRERKAGMPVYLFIESAKSNQTVRDKLSSTGKNPNDASFYDWYFATKQVSWPQAGVWSVPKEEGGKEYDAGFVALLTATELFPSTLPTVYTKTTGSEKIDVIDINYDVAHALSQSYSELERAANLPARVAGENLGHVTKVMRPYSKLTDSARLTIGHISFGNPKIMTWKEMRLSLPQSLVRDKDVYWVEFAVSLRDIEIDKLSELSFEVSGPEDMNAIELIPFRHDSEKSVSQTASSPEIKVEIGQASVSVGKIYEQEVVYKSLAPRVFASGLQENEFAWSMLDEAIRKGSHRFIALLQVPKRLSEVTVNMKVSAKTRGLFLQGSTLGTHPVLTRLQFPK